MKIYPSNSNIIVTNEVNLNTDIALSFVDTQKMTYSINTIVKSEFKNKTKQEVLPYEKMNKNIVCLFDKYGNKLDSVNITKHFKREGDDYIYIPYGSTIFNPKIFEYSVTAKKNIIYNSKMQYDLKVSMISPVLADSLMPIFGDAPSKNIAPSNILVNSGSLNYEDLITGNLKNKDIAFVTLKSPTQDEYGNMFNPAAFTSFKTNLFSFISTMSAIEVKEDTIIDYNKVQLYEGKNEVKYKLKKPLIYDSVEFTTNKFFTVPPNTDKIIYHNIFENTEVPILLEEHLGDGFVVYCVDDLSYDVVKNSSLLYEVMFYIYSKSYAVTKKYREWIADTIPDFIVVNNKLTKKEKFLSHLELHKMFGLNKYEVTPYSIDIDSRVYPYVKFTGLNNNYLTFEKDISDACKDFRDPVKKETEISMFTARQDIIYFNNFLYKIDDSLDENIKVEKVDNYIKVNIKPFRHSSHGIYIKTLTDLSIPLFYSDVMGNNIQITNADFHIVCKQNESASYLEYVQADLYKKSDGLILATIQVRQDKKETLVYDMRQRGGGLPESEKDNYNCFDIGHMFGRPYRKGGSLIVTLPKKLKPFKDRIEETVKQYCVAEEYPIILFEEE